MTIEVQVGRVQASVEAKGELAERFTRHVHGFEALSSSETHWSLRIENEGPKFDLLEPVSSRSKEVQIGLRREPQLAVSARLRPTATSVLRRLKRVGNAEHWREGRWSLLLRNAFELPFLALLEYEYGMVPVHAATLGDSGGAVMLLGHNGAGKSTLACKLMDRLPLDFLSDNFSPCDGKTVVSFPGRPRPKPGDVLPSVQPVNRTALLRGVVFVGLDAPHNLGDRRVSLTSYLNEDFDAHRGSGWSYALGGAANHYTSEQNNARVARLIATLPYFSYSRDRHSVSSVADFVERVIR